MMAPKLPGGDPGFTRIAPTERDAAALEAAAPVEMRIQTANALVTGAPIPEEQLQLARAHFRLLADLLSRSGPRFSNPARDAVNLHNVVIVRLRESVADRARRAARDADVQAGLVEIDGGTG